jgi:Tol biopolymer transport system component
MKRRAILSLLVAVAATAGAPLCNAQTASTPSILFSRTYVAGDGSTYSGLYRIKPSGEQTVPLTITAPGVTFRPGDWSPDGSRIVYERLVAGTSRESQLFVTGRQGPSDHPITSGSYMHQQPSWGPGGLIAFISDRGNHNLCLSLAHADSPGQQDLFCPDIFDRPSEPMTLSTPKWNPSGKAVIFEAAAWEDNLDESDWVSHVYRVNVTTRAAVELAQQHLPTQTELTVASDVKQGIYARRYQIGPMYHVDFVTGSLTPLENGRSPKYSRDGSRVAFDRGNQVYVMKADGTNVHAVIADPDPNAGYSVADWSWDGTRLLVNKTGMAPLMQIVELATGSTRDVGAGSAAYYGWYHD